MKKLKWFPIILCISICLGFSLCACGGDSNNEKYTQLSKENVHHYLAFNMVVSECVAEYTGTDVLNTRQYDLSCVVTISTTRAADCYFKYFGTDKDNEKAPPVLIQYNINALSKIVGKGWTMPDCLYAQIGYDGTSAVSFSIKSSRTGLDFPNITTVNKNNLTNSMFVAEEIVLDINGVAYYN